MNLFCREPLFAEFDRRGFGEWGNSLRQLCSQRCHHAYHGNLPGWIDAWQRLPDVADANLDGSGDAVTVTGAIDDREIVSLRDTLMKLHPWRKGPFEILGLKIDTEWRCDWKWNRITDAVDLRGRFVLDVGSGNGYYGWRMLAAGADFVVGCDPMLLYVMQFEVLQRYAAADQQRHFVMPVTDTEVPQGLAAFDVVFSMGVLYHRTSPIDHLQTLCGAMRRGGKLVLETLVYPSADADVLVPEGRYAKMRNVWFIPSLEMLKRMLRRTGFADIEVIDVSTTTTEEQRSTDWMKFESLADFLDPNDASKTLEGYPAPTRAMVTAIKNR